MYVPARLWRQFFFPVKSVRKISQMSSPASRCSPIHKHFRIYMSICKRAHVAIRTYALRGFTTPRSTRQACIARERETESECACARTGGPPPKLSINIDARCARFVPCRVCVPTRMSAIVSASAWRLARELVFLGAVELCKVCPSAWKTQCGVFVRWRPSWSSIECYSACQC